MATSQFKNGIKVGGSTYAVSIKSYDTQSSVTRAGALAKQAIQQDNVDLLFASSTPETVNAVASEAETLGTPLICSNIPWSPGTSTWAAIRRSRRSSPSGRSCTSWALSTWRSRSSRCGTGSAPRTGTTTRSRPRSRTTPTATRSAPSPPILKGAGYTIDMSTAYPDGLTNYTSMITEFKNDGDDFFTNVPLPPDFATM